MCTLQCIQALKNVCVTFYVMVPQHFQSHSIAIFLENSIKGTLFLRVFLFFIVDTYGSLTYLLMKQSQQILKLCNFPTYCRFLCSFNFLFYAIGLIQHNEITVKSKKKNNNKKRYFRVKIAIHYFVCIHKFSLSNTQIF